MLLKEVGVRKSILAEGVKAERCMPHLFGVNLLSLGSNRLYLTGLPTLKERVKFIKFKYYLNVRALFL